MQPFCDDVFANRGKYDRFLELVQLQQQHLDSVVEAEENGRLANLQQELQQKINRIKQTAKSGCKIQREIQQAQATAYQQEHEVQDWRLREMRRGADPELAALMQDCRMIEYIRQFESAHLWQLEYMTETGKTLDVRNKEIQDFRKDVGKLSIGFPRSPKTIWPWPSRWSIGRSNFSQHPPWMCSIQDSREVTPISEVAVASASNVNMSWHGVGEASQTSAAAVAPTSNVNENWRYVGGCPPNSGYRSDSGYESLTPSPPNTQSRGIQRVRTEKLTRILGKSLARKQEHPAAAEEERATALRRFALIPEWGFEATDETIVGSWRPRILRERCFERYERKLDDLKVLGERLGLAK